MSENEQKAPGMNVGTSLILVAFVLLCLVTFSALSYSSARADYGLTKQTAQRKQEYYRAIGQVEASIAFLDRKLTESSQEKILSSSVINPYASLLQEDSNISVLREDQDTVFCITVSMNDTEEIVCKCLLQITEEGNLTYTRQSFRTRQKDTGVENSNPFGGNGGFLTFD